MPAVLAFRNRQRIRPLNTPLLRRLARHLLEKELGVVDYELGFQFVSANEMARVNQTFLQHEGSTDIITFDHRENPSVKSLHGEIFISISDAVSQAKQFNTTWQMEMARYMIHGLLHLRGHDDLTTGKRRVMKREENRLLVRLAAVFDLDEISRPRGRSKPITRKKDRR